MKHLLSLLTLLALLVPAACGGHQPNLPDSVPAQQQETSEQPESSTSSEEEPLPSPTEPEPAASQDPASWDWTAPLEGDVPPWDGCKGDELAEWQDSWCRELVRRMSLKDKAAQLFFIQCPRNAAAVLQDYPVGGLLLFTRDYKDAAEKNWLDEEAFTQKLQSYQAASRESGGFPLFIGSDEEGGTVTRASRNPNLFPAKLPSPQELYKAGSMDKLLTQTLAYNERLCALGINVNFAPVCDVSTDAGDYMYARAFGQDAAATADYVSRVVPVMAEAGIGAVLKHFPGYGNNTDTHTGIAKDGRPMETFEQSDFLPFRAGIEAGAPFVLVSHNIVACMDGNLPASLSPEVHRILREELGFDGVILTDDLTMSAVKAYAEGGSVAELALRAGNDMIVTADYARQIPQLVEAVESGRLEEHLLDEAAVRVLRAKCRLGLIKLGE